MQANEITQMLQAFSEFHSMKIAQEIRDLIKPTELHDPYESEQTDQIATALANAQGAFRPVLLNRENITFKLGYSDLDAIMLMARSPLHKNGLCVTQDTRQGSNGEITLYTKLRHSSGQWISSRSRLTPEKGDNQSYDICLSHHKRLALQALLGITTHQDPNDSDAEGSQEQRHSLKTENTINKYEPSKDAYTLISKDQLEELNMELDGYPDIAQTIMKNYYLTELCNMRKSNYLDIMKKIRQQKIALSQVRK